MTCPEVERGFVSLTGAGPGDPGLLTIRAWQRLQAADVIVYDRLVSAEVLALANPAAERISVGKARGRETLSQEEINALLIERAQCGERVVRLKGGDPFVFGRGGEEALALLHAGIPFEIIPGISSALAVPAVAGIPVTHRGIASAFTVVAGAVWGMGERAASEWDLLVRFPGTLVFLMGVEDLERITQALLAAGATATTPAALIESGATAQQRTLTDTLGGIAAAARAADVRSPAVLVVGETAGFAATIGAHYMLSDSQSLPKLS